MMLLLLESLLACIIILRIVAQRNLTEIERSVVRGRGECLGVSRVETGIVEGGWAP